jgi:exonuclease SbcC
MAKEKKERSLLDLLTHLEAALEDETERDRDRPTRPKPAALPATVARTPALRLEALEIENLWCYERAALTFDEGITVIAGPNGSGKSSLLESIFFALYGSKATPAMDRALGDILRLGTERGRVKLSFHYGNHRYEAQMALRRRKDGTVTSDNKLCYFKRLDGDDSDEWLEIGVERVTAAVEKLFGMTRDDFTNCIYVRQGEIDRLIRAGEEERRRMIDRLLRLEKLDRYGQRAREGARRAVGRKRDRLDGQIQTLREEIEQLEAESLEAQKRKLDEEIAELQQQIERLEAALTERQGDRQRLEEQLQRIEQQRREIHDLAEELEGKTRKLKETEKQQQALETEINELTQQYKKLEKQLSKQLEEASFDECSKVIAALRQAGSWEDVPQLGTTLEALEAQQEQVFQQRRRLEAEFERERSGLQEKREKLQAQRAAGRERQARLQEEIQEINDLLRQGKCPVCRQPVSEAAVQDELTERERQLKQLTDSLQKLEGELQALDSQLEGLERAHSEELSKLDEAFEAVRKRKGQLERAKDLAMQLIGIRERGRERRALQNQVLDALNALADDVARLRGLIAEKRAQLGDSQAIQGQIEKLQQTIEALRKQKDALQSEQKERLAQRGQIEQKLQRLKQLRTELTNAQQKQERLGELQSEIEELAELYSSVKRELRQRNIRALEAYFNRFFQLMDSGASYRGVRVSDEYEITVLLRDGGEIRPELLSGGERALINLALRSAIHQVLAQASSRLPLIFDEPTIYLDRDRVQRLGFLLDELGRRVGQVIVVSHEAGLVEGADHEYRTEKRGDNTSVVQQVR